MKLEDLKKEIEEAIKYKPSHWRDGQFVFNYIDERYGVARTIQFKDWVDCFYDESKIVQFIEKAAQRITEIYEI